MSRFGGVDPEWRNFLEALFQEEHPRREVFGFLVLSLLFAFSISTVVEFLLVWKGMNTEGLGLFVMGGSSFAAEHDSQAPDNFGLD